VPYQEGGWGQGTQVNKAAGRWLRKAQLKHDKLSANTFGSAASRDNCTADNAIQSGQHTAPCQQFQSKKKTLSLFDAAGNNKPTRPQNSPIDMIIHGASYRPRFGSWKCVSKFLIKGRKHSHTCTQVHSQRCTHTHTLTRSRLQTKQRAVLSSPNDACSEPRGAKPRSPWLLMLQTTLPQSLRWQLAAVAGQRQAVGC